MMTKDSSEETELSFAETKSKTKLQKGKLKNTAVQRLERGITKGVSTEQLNKGKGS